jgi:cysteine desulfurase
MVNIRYILIFSLVIILILLMAKVYRLSGSDNPNKLYYFDNNASTFIYDDDVIGEIHKWINCGNPSNNLHIAGIVSKQKIDESRKMIADDLRVEPQEILFTGNATEANNIIIQGTVNKHLVKNPSSRCTIMTTNFEHPSVLQVFNHYKTTEKRLDVVIVNINTNPKDKYYGSVDPNDIELAIVNAKSKVILLSVMYANNETGAVQDMVRIGEIAKKHNVFFHSDATQGIGKFQIHPKELNIDAVSFSGHKFHAPKGIGFLYQKKECDISGICYGGEQEHEERPGTENIAFIAAMALALKKVHQNRDAKTREMYNLRKFIKTELEKMDVVCIEPKYKVLPNTLLIILKGIDTCNKNFARELSTKMRICVGVSSACQTQSKKNSHVLDAMKIEEKNRDKIIRISLSDYTTYGECKYLVESLGKLLLKHRNV